MTQGDDLIPMIIRKEGTQRRKEVTFGNFKKYYDFDSTALCHDWFTLRSPARSLYSLTEKPGYLTLRCANVKASEQKTPAFIARRLQHHRFECETKILFEPNNGNESAGLLLYKDEKHQFFLAISKASGKNKIRLEKISGSGAEILSEQIIPTQRSISLKVVSEGTHYQFYYAPEDEPYILLAENISAHYLSTANSYGFTGTTIGMYATQKTN
jgi:alpha-N-arabinofuranosidase